MTTKPVAVYWDSCVYIDYIQQEPNRYPVLCAIMEDARAGKIIFVASTLVLAEVNKLKLSAEPVEQQAELIRQAFENDYIEVKGVTRDIAVQAAGLCRDFGIKPSDAIHVATALAFNCRCFQTYDGDKRGSERKKGRQYLLDLSGKIGRPPLRIELPNQIFQDDRPLFDIQAPATPPAGATPPG
jgi:predicted nucleic acid-binding protein